MGYFNNNYSNYPNAVSNMIQQVKFDALKIGAGLPLATMFGGGVLAQAAVAPEVSAAAGASEERPSRLVSIYCVRNGVASRAVSARPLSYPPADRNKKGGRMGKWAKSRNHE